MSSLAWQYMHASVAMWISSCRAAAICRIWPSPRLARSYCKPFVTPRSVCLLLAKTRRNHRLSPLVTEFHESRNRITAGIKCGEQQQQQQQWSDDSWPPRYVFFALCTPSHASCVPVPAHTRLTVNLHRGECTVTSIVSQSQKTAGDVGLVLFF